MNNPWAFLSILTVTTIAGVMIEGLAKSYFSYRVRMRELENEDAARQDNVGDRPPSPALEIAKRSVFDKKNDKNWGGSGNHGLD